MWTLNGAKLDFSRVERVGVDETAAARGQDYVSVSMDLDVHRALFVIEARSGDTVQRFAPDMISGVWMTYYLFISHASVTYETAYALTALQYGLSAASVALGYVTGSFVVRRKNNTADPRTILRSMLKILAFVAVTGLVLAWLYGERMWLNIALCCALAVVVGGFIPLAQAGAMDSPSYSTTSSGMFFFFQMIAGASYSAIITHNTPGSPRSMVLSMLLPMAFVGTLCLRQLHATRFTRIPKPAT